MTQALNQEQIILEKIVTLNQFQKQEVLDFIDFIHSRPQVQSQPNLNSQEKSTYQKFVESGLIGCVEVEENLSTTYKQVLAEELAKKYDHR
jgi:hypothetical protein